MSHACWSTGGHSVGKEICPSQVIWEGTHWRYFLVKEHWLHWYDYTGVCKCESLSKPPPHLPLKEFLLLLPHAQFNCIGWNKHRLKANSELIAIFPTYRNATSWTSSKETPVLFHLCHLTDLFVLFHLCTLFLSLEEKSNNFQFECCQIILPWKQLYAYNCIRISKVLKTIWCQSPNAHQRGFPLHTRNPIWANK